jgi:hypothetical protein
MVSLPSAAMLTKLSPSFVHVFPCEHSLLKYDPWLIPAFTDDSSVVDMVNRLFPLLVHPVPIPSNLFSFSVTCSASEFTPDWSGCIYLYSFSGKTPSGLSCLQKAPSAHPFVHKAHLHIYFLHLIPDRLGHVCLTGRMSLQLKNFSHHSYSMPLLCSDFLAQLHD